MVRSITWPNERSFAFTIVDDTDLTTLENGPPVYDFLYDHGFPTTKTIWPIAGSDEPLIGGATCEDPDYLAWIKELEQRGFEIALHNATYHSLTRDEILRGLETYRCYFGDYPKMHINHYGCTDALYWGDKRLTSVNRLIYNILTRFKNTSISYGHVTGSDKYWGDVCSSKIKYVRNFVYPDINTLKACPQMPYHDKRRPLVKYWFASSEGADCASFIRTISEANQDRLEGEGGACIMYTHFGKGFFENGHLNSEFQRLMERLSRRNGWFVPASELLDYLKQHQPRREISYMDRMKLEWKWLAGKIAMGGSS